MNNEELNIPGAVADLQRRLRERDAQRAAEEEEGREEVPSGGVLDDQRTEGWAIDLDTFGARADDGQKAVISELNRRVNIPVGEGFPTFRNDDGRFSNYDGDFSVDSLAWYFPDVYLHENFLWRNPQSDQTVHMALEQQAERAMDEILEDLGEY